MDAEILSWFGNLLNFVIFVYIFSKNVSLPCFNNFEMSLSLIGIGASIFIQAISLTIAKSIEGGKKCL